MRAAKVRCTNRRVEAWLGVSHKAIRRIVYFAGFPHRRWKDGIPNPRTLRPIPVAEVKHLKRYVEAWRDIERGRTTVWSLGFFTPPRTRRTTRKRR